MTLLLEMFTYPFIVRAFAAGVLLSLCAALLGVPLVLKRYSMIGDGLSHVSFGALSVALACGWAPLPVSIPVVIVAALGLLRMTERSRMGADAAIAVVSASSLAVGVIVTSLTTGMTTDVDSYMFGSFQPDCNPLTYLKGSLRAYKFRGHNYSNSQHYIYSRISRLQRRQRWTIWQYYTLGKLTHYLADAFTYPHNENYPDSMLCHHQYETDLRAYLEEYLATRALRREKFRQDVADALQELHRQYMAGVADMRKDVQFILKATSLLMAGCLPASAAAAV